MSTRTTPRRQPPTHQQPTPRPSRSLVVIGILLAAIAVIAIAVVVLVGGDDDDAGELDAASYFKTVAVDGAAIPALTSEVRQSGVDPAIGAEAPVVSGTDYAGTAVTIDPANDGPTMVVLLAHWCPHCNAEIPVLNEWRDSGDVPDELNIVGVSTGLDPDAANFPPDAWLNEMDWQWPVLADSDVSIDDPADDVVSSAFRAYGGTTFPTMILIGSDGRVLSRVSGELPVDAVAALVDEALAQDVA